MRKQIAATLLTSALLCIMAVPAMADRQTRRTEAICKTPLATRQSLADQGYPDGIFCLATYYAYRFGDERYPDDERLGYRVKAVPLIQKAASLGYDIGDLERHITGGDNITETGSYFRRVPREPSTPPPKYTPPSYSGQIQPSYNCTNGGNPLGDGTSRCY